MLAIGAEPAEHVINPPGSDTRAKLTELNDKAMEYKFRQL